MESSNSITVEITVRLPVEKVWLYWNQPEHITQWYQASPDWHAPFAENNLSAGGNFKTTMAAKDGSMAFDLEGTYTNIKEHQLIEYTLADGRKVSITFAEFGQSTILTETFEPESTNSIEMQQGGWQAILESFKTYAEAQV